MHGSETKANVCDTHKLRAILYYSILLPTHFYLILSFRKPMYVRVPASRLAPSKVLPSTCLTVSSFCDQTKLRIFSTRTHGATEYNTTCRSRRVFPSNSCFALCSLVTVFSVIDTYSIASIYRLLVPIYSTAFTFVRDNVEPNLQGLFTLT